jgi:putative heme-binding domain-containing protein
VFAGGTNTHRLYKSGHLEAMLTASFAESAIRFRDWSWEADTVYRQGSVVERWRKVGFGDRAAQLKRLRGTVVILQFGQLEAMDGTGRLAEFATAYESLIDDCTAQAKTVVLLSPLPFETPESPHLPELARHNDSLAAYVEASLRIAQKRSLRFIDLFTEATEGWTENGMHVLPAKQQDLATLVLAKLGLQLPAPDRVAALLPAVREKNRLWFDYWRPANWKLLYGDDSKRVFTRGGKTHVPFREEWLRLLPLVEKAEARIQGNPGYSRPPPETLHADPDADIAQELAAFTVAEGLQVNLFASEAHGLTAPLAIRWDPRGRAWVSISTAYPHIAPGDVFNDKILILEDVDGDGQADTSTVFADGLNIPTGFELGDGGVYVGASTELLFLQDRNGDDKADTRTVLLSGFGSGDSHQTINSFIWSPSGELYMGQGDGVESRVETPWGSRDLFQSGIYRLRPRRLQLDPLLDDFAGPANPWGVAFDDWGRAFVVDGAGGVSYLGPGEIPTTHKAKLRRIGKPGGYCGIGFLSGQHLPAQYRGQFVTGDFKRNRIARFSLQQKDAGFDLSWETPLLESSHRNFRPVDVNVGPDGAVYVVDWYNSITCHQNDAYRDPQRDKAQGRIWRISAERAPGRAPALHKVPIIDLFHATLAAEQWTRYQTVRELTTREPTAVSEGIDEWMAILARKDVDIDRALFEVLGLCATMDLVRPDLLRRALAAQAPEPRAFAVRVIGRWHDRLDDPLALLATAIRDEDPLVRLEAIVAAAHVPSVDAIHIVAAASEKPMDSWLNYAFGQAVHHLKPQWLPAFQRGELKFANSAQMALVISKVGGELAKDLWPVAMSTQLDIETRQNAMEALLRIDPAKAIREFALNPERFHHNGVYQPDFHAAILGELANAKAKPGGAVGGALKQLIAQPHETVQVHAVTLAGLWAVKERGPIVEALARDEGASLPLRRAALKAMVRLQADVTFATADQSASMRAAAAEALTVSSLGTAATHAADLLTSADAATIDLGPLLSAFFAHPRGPRQLANVLKKRDLNAATAAHALQALYTSGKTSQGLVAVLQGVSQTSPYSELYVSELVAGAKAKGDPTRGAALSASCLACHQIGETGGIVGPDLSAIGNTLTADRIVEELLWPGRQVKEGYTLLQVTRQDGSVVQGFERITRQGGIALRELTVDRLVTIPKGEIRTKTQMGSAMPTGLTAAYSEQQLFDLIAYLTSLK